MPDFVAITLESVHKELVRTIQRVYALEVKVGTVPNDQMIKSARAEVWGPDEAPDASDLSHFITLYETAKAEQLIAKDNT